MLFTHHTALHTKTCPVVFPHLYLNVLSFGLHPSFLKNNCFDGKCSDGSCQDSLAFLTPLNSQKASLGLAPAYHSPLIYKMKSPQSWMVGSVSDLSMKRANVRRTRSKVDCAHQEPVSRDFRGPAGPMIKCQFQKTLKGKTIPSTE